MYKCAASSPHALASHSILPEIHLVCRLHTVWRPPARAAAVAAPFLQPPRMKCLKICLTWSQQITSKSWLCINEQACIWSTPLDSLSVCLRAWCFREVHIKIQLPCTCRGLKLTYMCCQNPTPLEGGIKRRTTRSTWLTRSATTTVSFHAGSHNLANWSTLSLSSLRSGDKAAITWVRFG